MYRKMRGFIFLFVASVGCLQIQAQTKIVNPGNATSPKIEVVGKKTDFGNLSVYVYNPIRNDSHIYMGYYYSASQLDSIFGTRTETMPDYREVAYRYGHQGVLITMTPADDLGLFSIILVGDKYRCSIEGVEMQVGDNVNRINWSSFNKFEEKTFDDGTIRRWYRTEFNDLLVVKHKNNLITEIRFDLDF